MFKLTLLNIGVFQGLVIGLILLQSPFFKNKANRYLGFAMLSLSWSLLNLILETIDAFDTYPWLAIVDILDSSLLFPVLVLLAVSNRVGDFVRSRSIVYAFVGHYVMSVIHGFLDEFGVNALLVGESYPILTWNALLGFLLFVGVLCLIPWILLETYRLVQRSTIKEERYWLGYLLFFESFFLASWLAVFFLGIFFESSEVDIMYYIALLASLLIHWVAYFGVYKLKLANDQRELKALLLSRINKDKLVSSVVVTEPSLVVEVVSNQEREVKLLDELNPYYQQLERLCQEQKIYRDSTLDRNKVADMLGISPSYLSQLVNRITADNFSTYINRYRVEEVKALIMDEAFDNYNLLSIGLECGFSSKTTYYNSFKKMTGTTPSAYRKARQ